MAISHSITKVALKSFVERLERLEQEKAQLSEDIRDVFAEAKSQGFDVKIIRQVLKLRKMDRSDRLEQAELLNSYLEALEMTILEDEAA